MAYLAVPKQRRRQGFGRKLMKQLTKYAKGLGNQVACISLCALPGSTAFYRALGFKVQASPTDEGTTEGGVAPGNGATTGSTGADTGATAATATSTSTDGPRYAPGQVYMTMKLRK